MRDRDLEEREAELKGELRESQREIDVDKDRLRVDEHRREEIAREIAQAEREECDRGFEIIVNGRKKTVHSRKQSFDEIVALAFDVPPTGINKIVTVTFRRGPGDKPDGMLTPGGTVKIKEGMIFNVTATDKS